MLTVICLASLHVVQLTPGHSLTLLGLRLHPARLDLPRLCLLLPPVVVQDVPLDDTPQLVDVQLGVGTVGGLLSYLFLLRLRLHFGFFTGLLGLSLLCKMRNSEVSVVHCNIQIDTGKTIPMLPLVKAKSNLPPR